MTSVRGSSGAQSAYKKQETREVERPQNKVDVTRPQDKAEPRQAQKAQRPMQFRDEFQPTLAAETRGPRSANLPTLAAETAGPRSANTAAVQQVNGDPAYQQALQTQRELSTLRQQMGTLQLELDNRGVGQKIGDLFSDADERKQEQINQLQQQITALEQTEATQPQDAVERARFTVFNERMAQLEAQLGKEGAATIARQTYYNSDVWNNAAGTEPASAAAINAAGLPHEPGNNADAAVGGFSGHMRTPDGREVDMGHVAAALDWQVNASRIPDNFAIPQAWNLVSIDNPFNLNAVTVMGDVASAMTQTDRNGNLAANADTAIAGQQDYDWNGDIDGLNLANRLRQDPNLSITDALNGYYGTGQYQNRINEYATHGDYIRRDSSGAPLRDAQGNYQVDTQRLANEGREFAEILDRDVGGILGVSQGDYPATEVSEAWARWLNSQPR